MKENILKIRKQINKNTKLVVVTKKQSISNIKKIYSYGERDFGENRVQELIQKQQVLPSNINWHLIGRLQSNKVKLIAPFIHLIQSVDSIKLLEKINKYANLNNRNIDCLIQIKISSDTGKSGFSIEDALDFFNSDFKNHFPHITIRGIMCIGTLTKDFDTTKREFMDMKNLLMKTNLKNPILSMGMSNDYILACQLGSNMIRIGSLIFK